MTRMKNESILMTLLRKYLPEVSLTLIINLWRGGAFAFFFASFARFVVLNFSG